MALFGHDKEGPHGGHEDHDPPSPAPERPAPARQENGGNGRSAAQTPTNGRNRWGTHTARVISVVSRKGGVGKTTSAVNLGAAFALNGHTVLVIGVDPQCGVSRTLGYGQQDLRCGLLDLFSSTSSLSEVACPTPLKDLYFVSPSIWSLEDEERYAALMRERTEVFVGEVGRARNLYDTILIDCPPGLHPATRAALLASDGYLVPVQAEELCRDSLGRLLSFVEEFTARALDVEADPPQFEGMFLTMVSDRTRMGRHVAAEVEREYGEHLYRTGIPRTIRLTEMALRGRPAVIYDRRSAGSRAYFDLMDEICEGWRRRQAAAGEVYPDGEDAGREIVVPVPVAGAASPLAGAPLSGLATAEPPRGLAGLLADLEAGRRGPSGAACGSRVEDPDLVSLDELLDEEESGAKERDGEAGWEEDDWQSGWGGGRGRLH